MPDILAPNLVSDFLIASSREKGELLTNLKLQKLLFYAQAWFITLHDDQLFEEDFQAWVHGPVLPSQYHRFSEYRWRPILAEAESPELRGDLKEHLTEILDVFGVETAVALEKMTHDEMPWQRARGDIPEHEASRSVIEKPWMREFYSQL